ncbi:MULTISPECIES: CtrA inhibitor SciP [unclassified Roseivivax]|uniref:CtrA inhibitor SciP n=1 Tax=Roseivivax sp. GX 12232 TaxID=2900547 RepID=UPI001E4F49B5|nr:DUF1153 domain-containing protein [Roseivivax sp. GX 12232]MCE0503844.1 DUF1153 domain-containing protein [Roseivivax sp. GX 12232]
MYLKKVEGPRAVRLPDGSTMTRADLPPPETVRWVASRKLAVVKAVRYGLLTAAQAIETYKLSEDELGEWMVAVKTWGKEGLKTTCLQKRKQV